MEGHHPKRCPLKTRPPKWKEKLREICLSRVREDRSQLLHKFRLSSKSAINSKETAVFALEQIVSEELIKVRNSSDGDIKNVILSDKDDAIWDYEPSQSVKKLDNVEYQEILLEMQRLLYDDIEVELKQRDADLLEDYEKACALEDESLAAAFSEHMKIHEEQNGGLLCPICRKEFLKQRSQLIYCECCELKLDIQSDQVDIEFLRKRLSEVLEEHYSKGCKGQTKFCIESQFNIYALYMQCSMCEAFEIVL
ncbi:uncharacterized protein LOC131036657 isoform X1 [Cryptomeria japonica]|uniref:uncharacterized protein LOC131036657 isoform X1 n=1 Tax=Cryptomeria japonica TaxID=3369 RepID=UPI0025AD5EBD|nr:uncharacterized protein LOC131036657 isoform X1 [Cryptomeria japonica]XP_057824579.1 uncharacterized protein LOC131036657 isoform X1 [Cryptomeria japonica]XP_057824580.1 uncharacterized protein LOC131036657 isoform X1 [Cryptomeria japonica]